MSTDSFGMAFSSLPIPALPSPTPADSSSKKPAASNDSSSASSSSSDPLLVALSQTLSQLGYTMPAGSLDSRSSAASSTDSAAATTGAQFLAALYQALSLQQSIATGNGGTSSSGESTSSVAGPGDATASSSNVGAYRDLSSRIAELSNAAQDADDVDSDAGEWDIEFDDVSEPSDDDEADETDPLGAAISNLDDALQAHVAALDHDPGATVTLSDVLDGLSNSASSLNWQPVGLMVDVAI
jgi:hypothetical protein